MINKDIRLHVATKLRDVLLSIEGILEGYEGIEDNKSYVEYCFNKAKEVHIFDTVLIRMIEDTAEGRGVNVATLIHTVEGMFKLLDDIDTASDAFKPKWCKVTSVVDELQRLRWLYCTTYDTADESIEVTINGDLFRKESRVLLYV